MSGRLRLIGTQGHVAYPHLADNPIRRLPRVIEALQDPSLDEGTIDFDRSNLEIVNVDVGNRATNVIPGEVRLAFNIRFNNIWSPASLAAEIERRVAAAAPVGSYELAFEPTNAVAFLTERGPFTDLVSKAVSDVTGRSRSSRPAGAPPTRAS